MDKAIDPRTDLASKVRDVRRVGLGELADRAAEARCERSGVAFNSSI